VLIRRVNWTVDRHRSILDRLYHVTDIAQALSLSVV
jgi:hypothetical protein